MSKLVLSCFYFTSFFPLWISILFIDKYIGWKPVTLVMGGKPRSRT